ncbi:hypothetical protein [Microvirga flavescens]|uniref:hypothetical protein n=1 Tax=Microvirga flavescens TaxID=2249811 RepID=UPI000DD5DD40|nr:hypothetical protein [Microvirga flavescens]
MLRTLKAACLGLLALTTQSLAAGPNAFDFVALGDMPYNLPKDYEKFDRLIATINKSGPAFSLHIGDIKSGSSQCSNENFQKVFDQFATFEGPLVYTPGDNEWTDCHREAAGKFDPLERLSVVRSMFYPKPGQSLGRKPMPVESQALVMPEHKTFVENVRFEKNGVMFVTLHVVGSNNNFEPLNPKSAMEYFERDKANIAWLDDSVKRAAERGVKAMVIGFQANPYDIRQKTGGLPVASAFANTLKGIERAAKTLNRPLLVIEGDEHTFEYVPLLNSEFKPIPNAMRLQVMGADQVQAVRVTVDPDDPAVFGVTPLLVRENLSN